MKGYYFQHLTIDLWPYSLTFDPHNETDLFVFPCLPLLPNCITIAHFILKFCMKMYIFSKIAVTFDLYIMTFYPYWYIIMFVYLHLTLPPTYIMIGPSEPKLCTKLHVSQSHFHRKGPETQFGIITRFGFPW